MVSPTFCSGPPSVVLSIGTRANSSKCLTWVKQQSLARGVGSSSGQKDEQSKQREMTPLTASLIPYNRDQPCVSTGGSTKRKGEGDVGGREGPDYSRVLLRCCKIDRSTQQERSASLTHSLTMDKAILFHCVHSLLSKMLLPLCQKTVKWKIPPFQNPVNSSQWRITRNLDKKRMTTARNYYRKYKKNQYFPSGH